jgi:hypothetical protein
MRSATFPSFVHEGRAKDFCRRRRIDRRDSGLSISLSSSSNQPILFTRGIIVLVVSYSSLLSCWQETSFQAEPLANCDQSILMCSHGSIGPLCGACKRGFKFDPTSMFCVECHDVRNMLPEIVVSFLLICLVVVVVTSKAVEQGACGNDSGGVFARKGETTNQTCKRLLLNPFRRYFRHVDRGMLKIVYSTAQIMSTGKYFACQCYLMWCSLLTQIYLYAVSFNLGITFPEPAQSVLSSMAFTRFDLSSVSAPYIKCC